MTHQTANPYVSDMIRSSLAGSAFGAALTLARVYLPDVILDQMRMKDFHMLEVFLTATSLSALVFILLEKLNITQKVTRSNSKLACFGTTFSSYDGNILGGAFIGTGMALAGACPGTVVVQLAQGIPIARVTMLGAVIGGTLWAVIGERVIKSTSKTSPHGTDTKPALEKTTHHTEAHDNKSSEPCRHAPTVAEVLNTNPTKTLITFLILTSTITTFSIFQLPGKSRTVIPTVIAGLAIALAQATSLIISNTPLGTSAAYEQIGRYMSKVLPGGSPDTALPPFPPKSIIFAIGMALGSVATTHFEPQLNPLLQRYTPIQSILSFFSSSPILGFESQVQSTIPTDTIPIPIPWLQALFGGVLLSFGARMAGGCTSGHGISGLSCLSWASLVSVMSMFAAGILVRLSMDFFSV